MAQEFTPPGCVLQALQHIYPTIDFSRVRYFIGLPWFTSIFSPFTGGQVLPAPSGTTDFHVFLDSFDPCDGGDVAILVHEMYHVAQFMSVSGGLGYGFNKAGYVRYFTCNIEHGYDNNPWETAASEPEDRFRLAMKDPVSLTIRSPCDCGSGEPLPNLPALDLLLTYPGMPVTAPKTPECGGRWAGFLAGLLTSIASFFLAFAFWLERFPRRNCQWLVDRQKECIEEKETIRQECEKKEDQGYDECAQRADQGHTACNQWGSGCCTWWPCSWGCKALVAICHAYTWVANWVCVAWTWVSKWVCVIWRTIKNRVCIAWTTVTRLILWCG